MIQHDVPQRSAEWYRLRLGIATASNFDKILTPLGKLSESFRKFAIRLATERVLGEPMEDGYTSEWMERGRELEADAAAAYAFATETETRTVGFITTDDGRLGASPDRLIVGHPGAVEIKSPTPAIHAGYLLEGFNLAYMQQHQGQIFVAELDFVDLVSFHPKMPMKVQRVYRDDKFQARMVPALAQFCEHVDTYEKRLRETGFFEESPKVTPPAVAEFLERSAPSSDD